MKIEGEKERAMCFFSPTDVYKGQHAVMKEKKIYGSALLGRENISKIEIPARETTEKNFRVQRQIDERGKSIH